MLRFAAVKEIVRLLVRFIVSLAAVLVLLIAGVVAVQWVSYQAPDSAGIAPALATLATDALFRALLPSVVIAALVSMFALLRVEQGRAPGLLLLFVLTTATIMFGMTGVSVLSDRVGDGRQVTGRRFEAGVLYRSDRLDFYAFDDTGLLLGPVVVHDPGYRPALRVVDEVVHDAQEPYLQFRGTDTRLAVSEVGNAYWQVFSPPPYIADTLDDVSEAAAVFESPFTPMTRDFLMIAGALGFFITMLWVPMRVSRWPLLNIILAAGMARGMFAVFSLMQIDRVREFFGIFVPAAYRHYLLPAAFAALGVILLLILGLLPSFQQWKREVRSG